MENALGRMFRRQRLAAGIALGLGVSGAVTYLALQSWRNKRRERRRVVAVHLDNVCADLLSAFVNFSNATFGTSLTLAGITSLSSETLLSTLGAKSAEEVEARFLAFYSSDFFREIAPIAGAAEGLGMLREEYELHLIVQRPAVAKEETMKFIDRHFPAFFQKVHFVPPVMGCAEQPLAKARICSRVGAALLIDDSPSCAEACAKAGVSTYLFGNYAWNQSLAGENPRISRVVNWKATVDAFFPFLSMSDSGNGMWSTGKSDLLQAAVDRIFAGNGQALSSLSFSFTIADPLLADCPLVGCSTGFGTLCGYQMEEIVGRNCRFLVDPVPQELVNLRVRQIVREFCQARRTGDKYKIPVAHFEPWMRQQSDVDGLFCIQTNARKDGSLFKNMFFLKEVSLADHPYIVGLQSEVPGSEELHADTCHEACLHLEANMAEVERVLAGLFWYSGGMRRQDDQDMNDGFDNFMTGFNQGRQF
mmetsp:Transcript_58680/g.108233  ORF Transcript_58680/g.108233 Transcript_58680/m.108233 type:complete len:476 (-) Transcript_58680:72-1499(-)